MAHWDDEQFNNDVLKNIPCSTCRYRAKPVTVAGYTQDRSGYIMCDKYSTKPIKILQGKEPCTYYEKE